MTTLLTHTVAHFTKPSMSSHPGNLGLSPPESNIPHISKADSPMPKTTCGVETMKIRTPESINNPGGGGSQARSSDSPASGSSQSGQRRRSPVNFDQ